MSRKKVSKQIYMEPRQEAALKHLSTSTRVPASEYVREAIDLLLERYGLLDKSKLDDEVAP